MPAPSPESGSAPVAPRCSRLRSAVMAFMTISWLATPVRVATKATPHASCSWSPSYSPCGGGNACKRHSPVVETPGGGSRRRSHGSWSSGKLRGTTLAQAGLTEYNIRRCVRPGRRSRRSASGLCVGGLAEGTGRAQRAELPTSAPKPYVRAAATPPSRICRAPPYHQLRLVTWVTTAPHRNSAIPVTTSGTSRLVAPRRYGSTGISAPRPNATKDEAAASNGEGRSSGSTPSSSRACTLTALSRSRWIWRATSAASLGSSPLSTYICASSASSPVGLRVISARSFSISRRADSDWLATEVYSPAAIEKAPAASPASPASTTAVVSDAARVPPATPAISATFETSPSIAPNTAGRSHPPVTSGCSCPIGGVAVSWVLIVPIYREWPVRSSKDSSPDLGGLGPGLVAGTLHRHVAQ